MVSAGEGRKAQERKQAKKLISALEAYELLVGEIGMNRREVLYELQLWELNAIVTGYRRRSREMWESTRWQTYLILCAMGAKLNSPKELTVFPWEKEQKATPSMSRRMQRSLQKEMAEINAQLKAQRNEENRQDHNSL